MEPVLTCEKLLQLLDEGHESASLDYKIECDLSATGGKVELAKDVAAMQVEGGFIVVGADDHGSPIRGLSPDEEKLLDEATLHKILAKWLPEPFEIRTAVHDVEEHRLGMIFVAANRSGLCVIQRDGQYDGKTVFRPGDVFVRHGSASERWRQDDIDRIVDGLVARRKEAWRTELRSELEQLGVAASAQNIVRGPSATFTWQLDAGTFDEAALELLRAGDDIPLRRLIIDGPAEAARLLTSGSLDDLETLIGRLTCLAATALTYGRDEWFDAAVKSLVRVYDTGFDASGHTRNDIDAVALWLVVLEHVMALGALAIRLENWTAMRSLALRRGTSRDFEYYPTWLRHALTSAARGNRLTQEQGDGRRIDVSLISLAATRVAGSRCLRPDVAPDDDCVLNSLCQFDALAAVVVIGEMGKPDSKGFYTNFARFYSERTEPAFVRLITDDEMRVQLFRGTDEDLAVAIAALNEYAQKEGFRFSGWWGFNNEALRSFLQRHLPHGAE